MTSIVGFADTFPKGESKEDREVNCFGCADAFPATVVFPPRRRKEKNLSEKREYMRKK